MVLNLKATRLVTLLLLAFFFVMLSVCGFAPEILLLLCLFVAAGVLILPSAGLTFGFIKQKLSIQLRN